MLAYDFAFDFKKESCGIATFILCIFVLQVLLLGFMAVLALREHTAVSSNVCAVCATCALVCLCAPAPLVAPSVSVMMIVSTLMFPLLDAMLISLYLYTRKATGIGVRVRVPLAIFIVAGFVFDTTLFILNIFEPVMFSFTAGTWNGIAIWIYRPSQLFTFHMVYDYLLVMLSGLFFIVKAVRAPRIYRPRYLSILFAFLLLAVLNALFVYGPIDMPFDSSTLLYAAAMAFVFWDTFRYSKEMRADHVMREVTRLVNLPIVVFDREAELVDSNESMHNLFPHACQEEGLSLQSFLKLTGLPVTPDKAKDVQFTWRNPCDRDQLFHCAWSTLFDHKTGSIVGFALIMHNMVDNYDDATGLANEQGFQSRRASFEKAGEYPLVAAFANINHLGVMNERYSREEGDLALRNFAEQLVSFFPERTFIAHRGASDIALLIPQMTGKEAVALFKRMKREIVWEVPEDIEPDFEYGVVEVSDASMSLRDATHEAFEIMSLKKLASPTSARNTLVSSLTRLLFDRGITTESHVKGQVRLCYRLCEELGLTQHETVRSVLTMSLHNIGLLSIPDSIVFKSGVYTRGERRFMETHAEIGYRLAYASSDLAPIAKGILHHHERWDGSGYPDGLKGTDIPIESRVVAIITAYDAMTHARPYSPTLMRQQAIDELIACSGSHFDPKVAAAFLRAINASSSFEDALLRVASGKDLGTPEFEEAMLVEPDIPHVDKKAEERPEAGQFENEFLRRKVDELVAFNDQATSILARVVEFREFEPSGHVSRIRDYTYAIAYEIVRKHPVFGLTEDQVTLIASASTLHDVGKIAIPDSILLKADTLTEEEFAIMKTHTLCGAELLERALYNRDDDFARFAVEIARSHHERWDGSGYPDGLAGSAIPLSAQIVALADTYDALVSNRPYKKAVSSQKAIEMIMDGHCGLFSHRLLVIFSKVASTFEEICLPEQGGAKDDFFPRYRDALAQGCVLADESESGSNSVGHIVSLLVDTNRELAERNHYDLSTRTFNRNYYIEYLQDFNPVQHESVGVVYFDVNALHEYNRDHGHAQGDVMLAEVAEAIMTCFTEYNVFRTGGDEFVAICENIAEADLVERMTRAEAVLAGRHLSVSVGYDWRDTDLDMGTIIKTADRQMYEHKSQYYSGRSEQHHRI